MTKAPAVLVSQSCLSRRSHFLPRSPHRGSRLGRQHSTEAVETLAKIMKASRSDRARILAANSLLDRAWDKPTQPIGGDPEEPLVLHEHRAAILAEVLRIAAARRGGGGNAG